MCSSIAPILLVEQRDTEIPDSEQTKHKAVPCRQQTLLIAPASPNIAETDKEDMMDKTVIAESKQP